MKFIRTLIVILGITAIISVIFTLTAGDQWWMHALDYPRLQITIVSVAILLLSVFLLNWQKIWTKVYLVVLVLAVLYQGYILSPYLLPVQPVVPDRESTDPQRSFSLLVANILMENRDAQSFIDLVAEHDPDVVLVMETDTWWIDQLHPLREKYSYYHEQPQDNHYGISLYTHLPMEDTQIHYFEEVNTPAIQTTLQLPSGDKVILYGVHPRPPLPENSVSAADKELIKIAERTKQANLPVVVAGDFNDVPWSFTIETFQEISQLRDIRVGRGLYNTFDAKNPILRLPLDHVFISPGLGLAEFAKPILFSSDHFALYVTLVVDESVR